MVDPVLRLQNGCIGYSGTVILRDISLTIDPGEVVSVVGPNGVGKSSLIKAASGTIPLGSGWVRIWNQDLSRLAEPERARLVAVVPQATNLPRYYSVEDVVMIGRTAYQGWLERESREDREAVELAMGLTEISSMRAARIGELSGGEQQRVLIARALAQSTPVLMLDEPTAHLDLRHQDRLLTLVRGLARERELAVLIALHDLNLVSKYSDRVALLSGGHIQSIGAPEEVLTPEELALVYGVRIHVMTHPLHGRPLVLTDG
jgi:iron complex transport system ATP-binding protein